MPACAAELVRSERRLIVVARGSELTLGGEAATDAIPIVFMASSGDPVAQRLGRKASLARAATSPGCRMASSELDRQAA